MHLDFRRRWRRCCWWALSVSECGAKRLGFVALVKMSEIDDLCELDDKCKAMEPFVPLRSEKVDQRCVSPPAASVGAEVSDVGVARAPLNPLGARRRPGEVVGSLCT